MDFDINKIIIESLQEASLNEGKVWDVVTGTWKQAQENIEKAGAKLHDTGIVQKANKRLEKFGADHGENIKGSVNKAGENIGGTYYDWGQNAKKKLEAGGAAYHDAVQKANKGLEKFGEESRKVKEDLEKGTGVTKSLENIGARQYDEEQAPIIKKEAERVASIKAGKAAAAAAETARQERVDKDSIETSKSVQDAAEKLARHDSGLDAGVQTHLGRAAKRVGMALGGKYDSDAAPGVGTHLARAGKRAFHYFTKENEGAGAAGAAGIAAGLGALALAKRLRGAKKRSARA